MGADGVLNQNLQSILQVKEERKELHTNIDVFKGKCCAVQHTLD